MQTATLGQVRKVLELLEEVPQRQVQDVLESGLLSDLLRVNTKRLNRNDFRKACSYAVLYPVEVAVDYTITLTEMISAGKYGLVHEGITKEHFPITGSGLWRRRELALFDFGRPISGASAINGIKQEGYEPSDIADLLALGAKFPELQGQFPIVALGSIWSASPNCSWVPILQRNSHVRVLHLYYFEIVWSENYRFLACRK